MTVNVQVPINSFTADGIQTVFSFNFGFVESSDVYVMTVIDGVKTLGEEYTDYTFENMTDVGGDVRLTTAPADQATVYVFRRTLITQQVDYIDNAAFPAEVHEDELDKITYILQELLAGAFNGFGDDGLPIVLTFDLSISAGNSTVTIVNSGGTDAVLPPWVSGTNAGIFHGEIVDSAPADGAVTTKPDGYVYLEI